MVVDFEGWVSFAVVVSSQNTQVFCLCVLNGFNVKYFWVAL